MHASRGRRMAPRPRHDRGDPTHHDRRPRSGAAGRV